MSLFDEVMEAASEKDSPRARKTPEELVMLMIRALFLGGADPTDEQMTDALYAARSALQAEFQAGEDRGRKLAGGPSDDD